MEKYRRVLKCIEKKHAKSLSNRYGLICKQMQYGDEDAALYIAKKNWTNRFDMDRETTGDFQASCPKNYAAFFSRCVQELAEFSGLSQTSSIRFQFRVLPLQRDGFLRFAS